jgi:hypothetical protein
LLIKTAALALVLPDLPQGHVNIRFADLEKKIQDCKSFFLQGQNEVFGAVNGFDIQR